MTGRWLTLNAAATRITQATGRRTSMDDVVNLGRPGGPLIVELIGDHDSVLESSVDAYIAASELATSGDVLAEHADKPSVRGGPDIGPEAEHEYARERET